MIRILLNINQLPKIQLRSTHPLAKSNQNQRKLTRKRIKNLKKPKEKIIPTYFYANYEADVVSKDHHIAYCISYKQRDKEDKKYDINFIYGKDCTKQFLNILPDGAVVYFHNLAYDARMFSNYIISSSIDKGTKTISQRIKYEDKKITFKDSFSLITMALSKFPETFKLKSGQKEMFPYKYYTFKRLETNVGKISEAGENEFKDKWDQKQFDENIKNLNLFVDENGNHSETKTDYFNMIEYVKFYCNQDVNILAQGYDEFRKLCLKCLNIDCDEVLTAASLANRYFEENLYYKVDNYYKYSGVVRAFIQQAVYGGRCMTATKFCTKIKI